MRALLAQPLEVVVGQLLQRLHGRDGAWHSPDGGLDRVLKLGGVRGEHADAGLVQVLGDVPACVDGNGPVRAHHVPVLLPHVAHGVQCLRVVHRAGKERRLEPLRDLLTNKGGKAFRVGVFLDFASLSTRSLRPMGRTCR